MPSFEQDTGTESGRVAVWTIPPSDHPFGDDIYLRFSFFPDLYDMVVEMWKATEQDDDGRYQFTTDAVYRFRRVHLAAPGPVDVDAILASLGDEYMDPGDDPWGGANLTACHGPCCGGPVDEEEIPVFDPADVAQARQAAQETIDRWAAADAVLDANEAFNQWRRCAGAE